MARIDALKALLAKVEADDIDAAPFWKAWTPESEDGHLAYIAKAAAVGSLDAAKALHEAVLPGRDAYISLHGRASVDSESDEIFGLSYVAGNPARAWLIAILKALIAEAEA